MSNLMKFFGAVMALLAVTLGVMTFVKPGTMDVYGIKLDTAAILFVGGILALGLGGVMDRLAGPHTSRIAAEAPADPIPVPAGTANFGRKAAETVAATTVAVGAAAATVAAEAKVKVPDVADTISALEQAKADVIKSMGGMDSVVSPPPAHEPPMAAATVAEEPVAIPAEGADPELYVLEEKMIRGRPSRILSDNTVEAETDEGWMRFEDMDHLNEYLDSVEEQSA